jgi:chromosome partitioning protein
MPIYIAVINQKGGAGKTATSVNLSGALHKLGRKVLAVDADPQQSMSDWMQQADPPLLPFAVLSMEHPQLHVKLPELADPAGFDYVVIDCPPGGQAKGNASDQRDRISRSAALLADFVLVPLQPNPTDFLAARRLRSLLVDLCSVKPDLQIAVVINEKKVGQRMSRTARENAFALLEDEGINLTVLETEIMQRNVISESVAYGVSIHDFKPKSSSDRTAIQKATTEYVALAKEIEQCLKAHSPELSRVSA